MKWTRGATVGLVALGAAVGAAFLSGPGGRLTGLEELEWLTLDYRQRVSAHALRADANAPDDIVLVLFDEASVEGWPYLSPFPRPVLADLIDALAAAGARTIGLDVYLDRLYPELNAREGGDDRLVDAIERAGNVILVARVEDDEAGRPHLARPHEAFASVAAGVGAAEIPTPFDVVRDGVLAVRDGSGAAPSWPLALYAHARGLDADALVDEALRSGRLAVDGLPEDHARPPGGWPEGVGPIAWTFPIRFLGPPSRTDAEGGTFPAFSASTVPTLATFTPEFFRDRIVLIGTGFHDSDKFRSPFYDVPTPKGDLAGWTFGVEVHANALADLLHGIHIRRAGFALRWALLLASAVLAAGLVFWRGALWGGVGTLVLAGGYAGLAVAVFDRSGLWIPMIPGLATLLLAYLGATAYVSIVEGRDKRFIRSAFAKYVSPAVVQQIAEDPAALRLGGQQRPVTVLFSDLAGFTSLAEKMDPEVLISYLNVYLSEMTDVVLQEGGTLDKYIGDAIMAFWNAPSEQADHAERALRCAVMMQRKMTDLNARWQEQGFEDELLVRIGINTGTVVVGNVGGRDRFDYSVIGDAVNLAARLEPANKTYDTLIMASEYTLAQVDRSAFRLRELDILAVKGKGEAVTVFEVVEMADTALAPEREEALAHFNEGLAAYRRRDWELAERYFEAALEAHPKDGPSRVYLERTRSHIANPPPADWDFVVRRTVK